MRILLDTHLLLWALTNDSHLPEQARRLIEDPSNDIYYSVIGAWEVQIKHMLHPDELIVGAEDITAFCNDAGYRVLLLKLNHIFALNNLTRKTDAPTHKDPFDRMLICQASSEGMLFLTHDKRLRHYDDSCIFVV
ncbi:MAG: type II toxin-antitoxin system VapC family toxin [Atopobiaceae bacterium]|nr:type II toxin-antitoxin system VapC family toxin [Atopobiaceae bacterium]